MELTDQEKKELLAQCTNDIISGRQADEQAERKSQEAERRKRNRQFSDKTGELEVVGHKKTGMQQPSSSTGFPRGPVTSGQTSRIPR